METIKGETPERAAYREKCKHYGMEGICYYYSGNEVTMRVTHQRVANSAGCRLRKGSASTKYKP